MSESLFDHIVRARAAINTQSRLRPRVGMILGSGLAALADELTESTTIPYDEIPGFPQATVPGHRGELGLGLLSGTPVLVMRGRFHFYEGHSMQSVVFPVQVMQALGCTTLIVTNAAGGLRDDWAVGDLMQITDHIFMPGLAGHHPLRGPNDERVGTRFPAVQGAYDADLAASAHHIAAAHGTTLHAGVYAMVSGPSFESSAELRMLRMLGADAVGMSTAPEVIAARHAGMRVLGISLITNVAVPDGMPANHAEVLEAGEAARPRFGALLHAIAAEL